MSSLSKVILVWGIARHRRAPNLGCRGPESPGWFDVLPKNSAPDVMHEGVCCGDEAANHQLPAFMATEGHNHGNHGCGLLNHLNSFHGGMFKLNAEFDADSLLYRLVILKAMAREYTCSLNGIHCPHRLVQWNHHYHTWALQSTLTGCQVT